VFSTEREDFGNEMPIYVHIFHIFPQNVVYSPRQILHTTVHTITCFALFVSFRLNMYFRFKLGATYDDHHAHWKARSGLSISVN